MRPAAAAEKNTRALILVQPVRAEPSRREPFLGGPDGMAAVILLAAGIAAARFLYPWLHHLLNGPRP